MWNGRTKSELWVGHLKQSSEYFETNYEFFSSSRLKEFADDDRLKPLASPRRRDSIFICFAAEEAKFGCHWGIPRDRRDLLRLPEPELSLPPEIKDLGHKEAIDAFCLTYFLSRRVYATWVHRP